jgi:Trypsin-like peptidase domain
MHTSRVSALLAAALLWIPLQRSSADTRYVWSDASGDEHVSREPPPQGILYTRMDVDADRCVIRSRTLSLHAVKGIRRYDSLEVGETVYTIGNPRRLERTLANGLVSGKRELEGERWIQFTAPISRGSSGGGLFDAQGNLIGITSLSVRDAQGINFAIPAEEFWR